MAWSASDLTGPVVIEPDSQGNVFTIEFGTPAGRVAIMAEVELHEADGFKRIVLRRAHMHSEGGAHTIGVANCAPSPRCCWKGSAMTKPSLREVLGRLGPIQTIPRVP